MDKGLMTQKNVADQECRQETEYGHVACSSDIWNAKAGLLCVRPAWAI